MIDDAKKSKLLALFNSLKDDDKDIIISMAESLIEKCNINMTNNVSINTDERLDNGTT